MLISQLTFPPINLHISASLFKYLVEMNSIFLSKCLVKDYAAGLSLLLVLSLWKESYGRLKHDLTAYSPAIGTFSLPLSWRQSEPALRNLKLDNSSRPWLRRFEPFQAPSSR